MNDKEEILKLQNALIEQLVDKTSLKCEIDRLAERSDFYENLYNETKRELYDLEIRTKNANNYGSFDLLRIIFSRVKIKIRRNRR